jgi:hypothetical protein
MRNQYKILAEKYSLVKEDDTRKTNLKALANSFQILKVIRWVGDVPENINFTLNDTLAAWAVNCASTIEFTLADFHNVNGDDAVDYEPEEDEMAEETVEYMIREIKLTYQRHSSEVAAIAPDITKEDIIIAIERWANTEWFNF